MTNEIWAPCVGWEGFYEVSSIGRVASVERIVHHPQGALHIRPRLMRFETTCHGYFRVTFCRNGVRKKLQVHRLVAEAFFELDFNRPDVNHIDGDRKNNTTLNLEWCTHVENLKNAVDRGMFHGRTNPNNRKKLTPESADRIKSLAQSGVPYKEISDQFDISMGNISHIRHGKRWGLPNGSLSPGWVSQ